METDVKTTIYGNVVFTNLLFKSSTIYFILIRNRICYFIFCIKCSINTICCIICAIKMNGCINGSIYITSQCRTIVSNRLVIQRGFFFKSIFRAFFVPLLIANNITCRACNFHFYLHVIIAIHRIIICANILLVDRHRIADSSRKIFFCCFHSIYKPFSFGRTSNINLGLTVHWNGLTKWVFGNGKTFYAQFCGKSGS